MKEKTIMMLQERTVELKEKKWNNEREVIWSIASSSTERFIY